MKQNKTRYNYGGCGRDGHNNKGKTYINYEDDYIPSPEDMQRCDEFKLWFNNNYNEIKSNLIDKGKYNEDTIINTFLKLYRILERGHIINNYRTYWNTAYFTNIFNETIKTSKYNNRMEYIGDNGEQYDGIDYNDNGEEQYDELIHQIDEWLNDNVTDVIEREIFIIYINTKYDTNYKMTYTRLSQLTGVDENKIKEIIPRIKKQIKDKFKKI
ncbi:MAG: hypothetical protein LBV71_16200 [Prevotella sp.]|jgi:hypothetical protein|nr:hypothetical protein [Prevotella sp.]